METLQVGPGSAGQAQTVLEWVMLNWQSVDDRRWLQLESGLDPVVVDALVEEFTRARAFVIETGEWVATLRAVSEPVVDAEVLSVRVFAAAGRIISLQRAPIAAVHRLHHRLQEEHPDIGRDEFVLMLCEAISDDLTTYAAIAEETVAELEEELALGAQVDVDSVRSMRQRVATLRRHLLPQREAFAKLAEVAQANGGEARRSGRRVRPGRWRELANDSARDLDVINELADRLHIIQDAMRILADQRINHGIYVLTVAAAFFLPLTFIASLLGMNVGGIPLAAGSDGFWLICSLLAVVALLQWVLFRRWGLF